MELETVLVDNPKELNFIFGQSHFIKTVEDLHEIMVTQAPSAKFGIAFCEASGPRLVRHSGNDADLESLAIDNAVKVGAGHTFFIFLEEAFPITILQAVKNCHEVANIFCATANPVQVVLAKTDQGKGVMGVIDGYSPKGVETEEDMKARKDFLRNIGYKL